MQKVLKQIHENILDWYELNGRKDLPWRNLNGENAPYEVYISEIMLQQTQVKTVLDRYYYPFLQKFPTLYSLSIAKIEDVLLLWRGLGYYSRARNLLESARICKTRLPDNINELKKLPGIGEYTAGAIACFGFNQAVSFVDGNIKRVLLRFFALENPKEKELQKYAQILLKKMKASIIIKPF